MLVALYCKCGAAARGRIAPDGKAKEFERLFRSMHDAPGCGPTDAVTARRARAKSEREATKEDRRGG